MGRPQLYPPAELVSYCREHGREATLKHYQCSRATLDHAIAEIGADIPTTAQLRAQQRLEWIRQHRPTAEAAARKFGCSASYIRILAKTNQLPLATAIRTQSDSPTNFDILLRLLCRQTPAEIAEECQIPLERITQISTVAARAGLFGPDAFIEVRPTVPHTESAEGIRYYPIQLQNDDSP